MATAKCDEGDLLILKKQEEKGKFTHAQCAGPALCVCWCHHDPEIQALRLSLLLDEGKDRPMFKVEAKTAPTGNYNTEARCQGGHTVFKKDGDSRSAYRCPFSGCGRDVY